ncbi:hypothetical protein P5673_029907 [Acropora cervicornis]|uniref:Uncharacterized protein n=1 Tax=Acropora cervicornis TaxID=6130 RepID=A0AAD9UTN8_ACRCE|nr:hypothetical protein P5673_029907 [Acropora cervicornis]
MVLWYVRVQGQKQQFVRMLMKWEQ